jgi:GT2 family glycosyltransferase
MVDVIIVNWNCGSQLRECLHSIAAMDQDEKSLIDRVIVIDNGSTDGSAEELEDIHLPLSVITNSTNLGFAAACNQGARASKASFLLLLNPDTRLSAGALKEPTKALSSAENQSVGIVGVQLIDKEGQIARTCARFPTPAMIAGRIVGLHRLAPGRWRSAEMTEWDHRTSREVDHVMGAFFLVKRSLFERLGGMDERFFVYLEDLDFSLRATRLGFKTLFLADTRVFHRGGGSSEQVKAKRLYYALSSRILYGFKHFASPKAWALLLATLIVEPIVRLAYAVGRLSFRNAAETLGAYALLWMLLPSVLRRRNVRA